MDDAERWTRVGRLFDAALQCPAGERDAFVQGSGEPDEVQREVLSLLASHEQSGTFLSAAIDPARFEAETDSTHAPPAEVPLLPVGTQIGHYRVLGVLGRGGMGVVYHAEDTRLHRGVALKLLSAHLAGDLRQRQRLRQEARAAAALTHPGIAVVYALEEFDDQVALVTEYLEGETLRAEIDRGPLPADRALDTAMAIATAMSVAHARGIVHRDLKPENILRTSNGQIKILDFGLAQFDSRAADLASWTRLTEPGLVAGTPPYMAPEQLLGTATDVRTDQFAFGVMLYEMFVGQHPFAGGSLPSTIARILAGTPKPPQPDGRVPPAVGHVIDRCLQKEPAARYSSTVDLVRELSVAAEPAASAPATGSAPPVALPQTSAMWWWQFHQLAAALVYWAMVWPMWHVHRDIGRGGLFFFFASLAAVVVSANLRIHLWFSSRTYPAELETQRAEVGRWVRAGDVAFVALLVAGGLMLPEARAVWATLLIAVGIGSALAFLIIEPATARAAFRRA